MALAGWDSNQMIAASKPLLDLATAGALDLAKASDIVTKKHWSVVEKSAA
jgi:hypothetical protein